MLIFRGVKGFVAGVELPHSKPALQELHLSFRTSFSESQATTVPRPWIWGLGETCKHQLAILLQEHGVVPGDAAERASLVLSKIGDAKVETALQSSNPWKDLKWLANACTPPLQLVKPLELQAAIDRRAKKGNPVGSRSQKTKGRGKGRSVPHTVDPSGLSHTSSTVSHRKFWGPQEAGS